MAVKGVSGIAIHYTKNAAIVNNNVVGIRDFSDRCYWKKNYRKVGSDAGIFLARMNSNVIVEGNLVDNFGAEGISIDMIANEPDAPHYASHDNYIHDNVVRNVGRAGIDIYGGNNNIFERNMVENANMFRLRGGISAYIGGGANNTFRENNISGYGVLMRIVDNADGVYMPSEGNILTKNILNYRGKGHPQPNDCGINESAYPDYGALLLISPNTTVSYNEIQAPSESYSEVPAVYVLSRENYSIHNNVIKDFVDPLFIHPDALGVNFYDNTIIPPCNSNSVCEFGETLDNCYTDCQALPGDANGDGKVDDNDLELLKQDYLGQPVHNTDFNSDGRVDCEDFAILQSNYKENQ